MSNTIFTSQTKKKKEAKQKTWLDYVLAVVAPLLLIIGVGLLLLDPIKNYIIKNGATVNAINTLTQEDIERNKQAEVTYNFEDVGELSATGVVGDALGRWNPFGSGVTDTTGNGGDDDIELQGEEAWNNAYDSDLEEHIRDNYDPYDLPTIGAIAIPDVGMNLPIYKGVSDAGMYLGAGSLMEGIDMGEGNFSLASHHSIHEGLLFEPLLSVEKGQKIYLTDLSYVYEYEIEVRQTVAPNYAEALWQSDSPLITLITCDSTLEDRIVVQGPLLRKIPLQSADDAILEAFDLPVSKPEDI